MEVIAFCKERVKVEVTSAYVINLRLRATGYQRPFYFGNKG